MPAIVSAKRICCVAMAGVSWSRSLTRFSQKAPSRRLGRRDAARGVQQDVEQDSYWIDRGKRLCSWSSRESLCCAVVTMLELKQKVGQSEEASEAGSPTAEEARSGPPCAAASACSVAPYLLQGTTARVQRSAWSALVVTAKRNGVPANQSAARARGAAFAEAGRTCRPKFTRGDIMRGYDQNNCKKM